MITRTHALTDSPRSSRRYRFLYSDDHPEVLITNASATQLRIRVSLGKLYPSLPSPQSSPSATMPSNRHLSQPSRKVPWYVLSPLYGQYTHAHWTNKDYAQDHSDLGVNRFSLNESDETIEKTGQAVDAVRTPYFTYSSCY